MTESSSDKHAPESAYGQLDRDHSQLMAILNRATALLADAATPDSAALSALTDDLIDCAREHHEAEEALMASREVAPEHLATHRTQHQRWIAEANRLKGETAASPQSQANLLRHLCSTLAFHILSEDQALACQLAHMDQGVGASEAFTLARNQHVTIAIQPLLGCLTAQHATIEHQHEALTEYSHRLEAEVAARTAELACEKEALATLVKEMEQARSRLMQSEKLAAIGQLAAGVAHEINNPVGYVTSNLSALKKYVSGFLGTIDQYEALLIEQANRDVDLQARIEAIRQSADLDYRRQDVTDLIQQSEEGLTRVRRIVADLKDFSRVGEPAWQDADLNAGLQSTLNVARNEIKYKAEVICDFGELPLIRCLPAQLNQVFLNLLVNAAHAIEERGTITVRTRHDGDSVRIEVSDTGKGIPLETQNRIFEPFFTTKPVGQGTGLGLAIAWDIANKHGGRISVESTPGIGTTFTLQLPVAGPEAAAAA